MLPQDFEDTVHSRQLKALCRRVGRRMSRQGPGRSPSIGLTHLNAARSREKVEWAPALHESKSLSDLVSRWRATRLHGEQQARWAGVRCRLRRAQRGARGACVLLVVAAPECYRCIGKLMRILRRSPSLPLWARHPRSATRARRASGGPRRLLPTSGTSPTS